jgi:hypothetical protein
MPPAADQRWSSILGGLTADGTPIPMSFEILEGLSAEWRQLLTEPVPEGIARLLTTARSLFAHSWFNYEFMAIAATVALQAVEATFRQVVFPEVSEGRPFRGLVTQGAKEGWLAADLADRLFAGVSLRNSLSHPETQAAFTLGMAAPMIENSHHIVNLLCGFDFAVWRASCRVTP